MNEHRSSVYLTRLYSMLPVALSSSQIVPVKGRASVREEVQAIVDLFDGEINMYEKELKESVVKYLKVIKMYNQEYVEQGTPIKTSPI